MKDSLQNDREVGVQDDDMMENANARFPKDDEI